LTFFSAPSFLKLLFEALLQLQTRGVISRYYSFLEELREISLKYSRPKIFLQNSAAMRIAR
jgi:hypothetical protein